MPNLGFTIYHLAFFLGFRGLKGHLYFKPPWASAPLSVGPKWEDCGATSGHLEGWFYS